MRKPRGDSTLKILPEERQREIVEHAAGHTLAETRVWLAADGIETSSAALSGFLSWWHLRHQFKSWEADAVTMIDLLRQKRPDLPEGDLQGYANEFFQLKAIKENDSETWLAFASARHRALMDKAKLEQRERELEFDKEKFRQSIKSNIERGLDALFEEIKANPQAVELFGRMKEIVAKETEAAT